MFALGEFVRWEGAAMAGLRERQRRAREDAILSAALRLFRDEGYGQARMERIAEEAEVSVGTLYNYHQNKAAILGALVHREVETVLENGAAIVADPPSDVHEALNVLMRNYAGHALEDMTAEMWRTAIGNTIADPASAFAKAYEDLDERIIAQMTEVLSSLVERGRVREDVDLPSFGQLLFDIMDRRFIRHVTMPDDSEAAMFADLDHANALFARAIAPAIAERPQVAVPALSAAE